MKISFARNAFQAITLGLLSLASISRADDNDAATAAGDLQAGDLVGIFGDSITAHAIYSVDMEDYLLMCQPQPKLTAIQFGLSGELADSLLARMKDDALVFKPTVATTCYGMNDGHYAASSPQTVGTYRKNMTGIVDTLKANGVHLIVVGTPTAVDTFYFKITPPRWDRRISADVYNHTLADLGQAAKEVARQEGVGFADIYGTMIDVMTRAKAQNGEDFNVAGSDGVHPLANGNIIMAYAFLKALGCDGNIGTVTVDMMMNRAEATAGTTVVSYNDGDVQLESTRYPFCFYGDNIKDPNSTRSILPFLPFNQDLNRYMLVVKNATARSLKVTWGKQSKTFSAADLAKGVNLADEFWDNPFSAPFMAVQQKITDQQKFETEETLAEFKRRQSLHDGGAAAPESQDLFPQTLAKWEALRDASVAAVVPVRHEIKIEEAP